MKKIGIACGCRKLNYGSILQSFALCKSIQKIGYECEFVWVNSSLFKYYNIRLQKVLGVLKNVILHPTLLPKLIQAIFHLTVKQSSGEFSVEGRRMFDEFKNEYLKICEYSYGDLKKNENEYQVFVCGSDQIWNSYEYYMDPMYFLRFTSQKKRVAYAPSFGEASISYYNRNVIKKYISEFRCLSVREKSGADICKGLINKDVQVVLDPTLLLTADEWKEMLDIGATEEEYCFVYFLSPPTDLAIKALGEVRKKYRIKSVPYMFEGYQKDERVNAGPKEFVGLIKNAKLVLTDSFHGSIFSVNFSKQFITFERNYNQGTNQSCRITDIMEELGLRERFISSENELEEIWEKEIDYLEVVPKLDVLRVKSQKYLENALR